MSAIFAAILAATSAFSTTVDAPLTSVGQMIQITSSNATEIAWKRSVVMANDKGKIIGDEGTVELKVNTDAIDTAASNSYLIATAARQSMDCSMQYLYSKTNQMARYCVEIAMHVAPESVQSNITGYVVKTETVGTTDHQWVWYDRVLTLKPIRFVKYAYYGGEEKVKAQWVDWSTNGVDIVVDGQTWSGCHECTVERPAFARNQTCLDLPNETWGGDRGIDWGDMVLYHKEGANNVAYFTGFVTNNVTGDVLYFDNGFLKGATE